MHVFVCAHVGVGFYQRVNSYTDPSKLTITTKEYCINGIIQNVMSAFGPLIFKGISVA